MTRTDLIVSLTSGGLYTGWWDLDDDAYDGLSLAFIQQAFADWVASLPSALVEVVSIGGGLTRARPKWIPEVYDCDNHSRSFANFIDEACAVYAVQKKKARGNPGCGKLNFVKDLPDGKTAGHAILWFIDLDGAARKFDPGVGDEYKFTANETARGVSQGESV